MLLFNNCRNRQHAEMFGTGAFFDLNTTGSQEKLARRLANELTAGETCIVASLDRTGEITFEWYKFTRESVKPDDTGTPCHAYFGKRFKTETLLRDRARRDSIYSKFFNVSRHFKRPSVMRA